eukprot:gnl/TRDRNA2_/TRDRNA2_128601_c2_seq1.p1 gnl/TRDRNA2_/TRDRNA2_128601_c2~~gnl/TRDRNA2_/TRDRNA2_128601_c2_seq1.p1  ORF type:complete len:192 (+),score=3.93 gnl/TRDRNA2_/TRDRNA2_128601_c2_seq1:19-594(+)
MLMIAHAQISSFTLHVDSRFKMAHSRYGGECRMHVINMPSRPESFSWWDDTVPNHFITREHSIIAMSEDDETWYTNGTVVDVANSDGTLVSATLPVEGALQSLILALLAPRPQDDGCRSGFLLIQPFNARWVLEGDPSSRRNSAGSFSSIGDIYPTELHPENTSHDCDVETLRYDSSPELTSDADTGHESL